MTKINILIAINILLLVLVAIYVYSYDSSNQYDISKFIHTIDSLNVENNKKIDLIIENQKDRQRLEDKLSNIENKINNYDNHIQYLQREKKRALYAIDTISSDALYQFFTKYDSTLTPRIRYIE